MPYDSPGINCLRVRLDSSRSLKKTLKWLIPETPAVHMMNPIRQRDKDSSRHKNIFVGIIKSNRKRERRSRTRLGN